VPYIDSADREDLEPHSAREAMTPGELNFQITCLVDQYLAGNLDYQAINDVCGALVCAKMEVYRRVASPYEDNKRRVNGEVYVTPTRTVSDDGTKLLDPAYAKVKS
jgi:hypothetical protein